MSETMAAEKSKDALDRVRRESTEIGRRVGLTQATAELLGLLQGTELDREALWRVVSRLNAMAFAAGSPPPPSDLDGDEACEDEATLSDALRPQARAEGGSGGARGARLTLTCGETGEERGATQYFLDWKPVAPRSEVELLLTGDRWLRGTIDWTGKAGDRPTFHVILGGWEPTGLRTGAIAVLPTVPIPRVTFELPSMALLRWPER